MHNRSDYIPPRLDRDKLKTLVHFVCDLAAEDQLGKTKLNKILYFSDMEAFLTLGRPITGETYVKHQFSPVSLHLDEALKELEEQRLLAIAEASGFHVYSGQSYMRYRFVSLKRPRMDAFSGEEVAIASRTIEEITTKHTARSISNASHGLAWESARIGEELPYFTAYSYLLGEINPDDMAWAQASLARRTAS